MSVTDRAASTVVVAVPAVVTAAGVTAVADGVNTVTVAAGTAGPTGLAA